jgi:hypothetical protein
MGSDISSIIIQWRSLDKDRPADKRDILCAYRQGSEWKMKVCTYYPNHTIYPFGNPPWRADKIKEHDVHWTDLPLPPGEAESLAKN